MNLLPLPRGQQCLATVHLIHPSGGFHGFLGVSGASFLNSQRVVKPASTGIRSICLERTGGPTPFRERCERWLFRSPVINDPPATGPPLSLYCSERREEIHSQSFLLQKQKSCLLLLLAARPQPAASSLRPVGPHQLNSCRDLFVRLSAYCLATSGTHI